MLKYNISLEYQFWFQKGKSTHMALITLVDRITEALDKGDYTVGVCFDLSKAFDIFIPLFYCIKGVFMTSEI